MDESPSVALELAFSVALSSVVAFLFVLWVHPLAYLALGLVVALVLLARRVTRPAAPAAGPRWIPLAVVPIDTMLWPTAVLGDVLHAHAQERERKAEHPRDERRGPDNE